VRGVGDGHEGLAILVGWCPDVILLDLMLPTLDARAFRAAQRTHRLGAGVPLVVVSASQGAADMTAELGAVATLTKPFGLGELSSARGPLIARRGLARRCCGPHREGGHDRPLRVTGRATRPAPFDCAPATEADTPPEVSVEYRTRPRSGGGCDPARSVFAFRGTSTPLEQCGSCPRMSVVVGTPARGLVRAARPGPEWIVPLDRGRAAGRRSTVGTALASSADTGCAPMH